MPNKATWNSKLKFSIVYPSEMDLAAAGSENPDVILGVVDEVSIDGIGYVHEDINGITKWGLGLRTKPPTGKTGRTIVSELDWVYKLLRWLAKSDEYFDIKVIELEEAENPSRGQWLAGQENVIGCKVEPFGKTYTIGEEPKSVIPFRWTLFKYQEGSVYHYIGPGFFSPSGEPARPGAGAT
jgi:hypothetical protein